MTPAKKSYVGPNEPRRPWVGMTCHYQSYGTSKGEYHSEPRAAIVTQVHKNSMSVGLCILNPTGMFFNVLVKFSEEPKPGHWTWAPFTK